MPSVGIGYKPLQRQQTEFFQLPFNELLAGLSAKQGQFDKADAEAKAIPDLIPEGGLRTTEERNRLMSELDAELNPITEQLYKTGEVNTYELQRIAKKYKNDPRINWLKQDAAMIAAANKLMAEGQFEHGLQDWKTQQGIDQLKWTGQGMVDSQGRPVSSIGEAYKYIAPEDTQKYLMEKMKSSVTPYIEHYVGIKDLTPRVDEEGNLVGYTGIDRSGTLKHYTYDDIRNNLLDKSKGKSLGQSILEGVPGDNAGLFWSERYKKQGVIPNEQILVDDILSAGAGWMRSEDSREEKPFIMGSTGASKGSGKTPVDKTTPNYIGPRLATNQTVILGTPVNNAFQAENMTKKSLEATANEASKIVDNANKSFVRTGGDSQIYFQTIQKGGKTQVEVFGLDDTNNGYDNDPAGKVAVRNFVEEQNKNLAVEQNKLKALKKQEQMLKKQHGITKDIQSEFKEKDPKTYDKSLVELGKDLMYTDVISSSEPLTALAMNLVSALTTDAKETALKALLENPELQQRDLLFGNKSQSANERFSEILEKNSPDSNLKKYLKDYNDILLKGVTYRNASTVPISAEGANPETTAYSIIARNLSDKAKISSFGYADRYGTLSSEHIKAVLSKSDKIQDLIKNNVFISPDTNEDGKLVFDVALDLGEKDDNGNSIKTVIEIPAEGNVENANAIYSRNGGDDVLAEREVLSNKLNENNGLFAEYPEIGTSLVMSPIDISTNTGTIQKGTYNFILPDFPNIVFQPSSLNEFIKFKQLYSQAQTFEQKNAVFSTFKNAGKVNAITDPDAYETFRENFQ